MSVLDTLGAKFRNMAAPSRFEVELLFPFGGDTEFARFMCKASSIPGETIGETQLRYQGQAMKIAGEREYADWSVSIYNTEDWTVRNDIEKWMKLINDPEQNIRAHHASYQTDLKVTQLSVAKQPIAVYIFKGAWPKELAEITLDWDTTDEVETFDCTFSYSYHIRG